MPPKPKKKPASHRQRTKKRPTTSAPLPHVETPWGMAAYAAALDHLGMISVTDTDGHIIYVNDQFVRACQYTREEVIGQDHRILKSGHHAPQFFKNMQKRIANGQPWRSHIRNRAKDGSHYWIDALISPLKHKNGRIAGYLSVGVEAMRDADMALDQTKSGPRGSFRIVEKRCRNRWYRRAVR